MKAPFLFLALSLMVMLPTQTFATGDPHSPDTLSAASGGDPLTDEAQALDLDEAFVFQERVYIHIYDINEKPLIDGAFTRKELKENQALKVLLRKSTRYLSIDRHYYYFVNEG